MILFPIIYILSFVLAVRELIKGDKSSMLLFFIFGLSIYTITLSLAFSLGFKELIPLLQPFKELLVLAVLGYGLWYFKGKFNLHFIDYLVLSFLGYTFLYVIIPIGDYGLGDRLTAFKSSSFFAIIYAAGRLFKSKDFYLSKYFHYILTISILASIVLLYEVSIGQHLQTLIGYADYNFYIGGQEPSGNYGLTWTFETENGLKRFASFFANPLEHAAATLLALAVIAGLYTNDKNQLKLDLFGKIAFAATQISVFFALSRASFVSYFAMIYVYALVTRKKYILQVFHAGLALIVLYFIFLITNKDVYDFVVDTLTFQNASSLGHVLEWLTGIETMISKPLGLGLGSSGKIAGSMGLNVGGENQFIIIGVQTGILSFLIYTVLQIGLIYYPYNWIKKLDGKERKVALTLFLLKIGSIIPLLTAEFESYIYISYISWFLCGLFISIITTQVAETKTAELCPNL